jgi:hypothetical protein
MLSILLLFLSSIRQDREHNPVQGTTSAQGLICMRGAVAVRAAKDNFFPYIYARHPQSSAKAQYAAKGYATLFKLVLSCSMTFS